MCLICVEFNKKRMTREEMRRALPEMVMFASNEDEKKHYKALQELNDSGTDLSLEEFIDDHVSKYGAKISKS